MSNDAGIYIFHSRGPEYRVAYGHAIENIYGKFNDETARYEPNPKAIVEIFGSSKVYTQLAIAELVALRLASEKELDNLELEYGVCHIKAFNQLPFESYAATT